MLKDKDLNKRERKRRGNSRYFLFFAVALFVCLGTGYGIYYALLNVSWFNLAKVEITNNVSIPKFMITNVTDKYKGQNLLAISTSDLRKSLSKISRVKKVQFHKHLPHTLIVNITERSGFLYIKSIEGDLHPIDSEGVILEKLNSYYNEDLPIVTTYITNAKFKVGAKLVKPYITKILKIHKLVTEQLPDFQPLISEYYVLDDTVYLVDAKYGTRVIPSDEDVIAQFRRYMFVQDNGNINRNSVIDLRFKNQVVVKAGNK